MEPHTTNIQVYVKKCLFFGNFFFLSKFTFFTSKIHSHRSERKSSWVRNQAEGNPELWMRECRQSHRKRIPSLLKHRLDFHAPRLWMVENINFQRSVISDDETIIRMALAVTLAVWSWRKVAIPALTRFFTPLTVPRTLLKRFPFYFFFLLGWLPVLTDSDKDHNHNQNYYRNL